METPQPVKPKRILSPEQIEKLKIARQKASATKRANKELDNYEKNKKKIEKEKKRDEVLSQIIKEKEDKEKQEKEKIKEEVKAEIKKELEPLKQEETEPIRKLPKPKKQAPPPPESEEESDEEEEALPPPPKEFTRKTKATVKRQPTDEELYSQASIQMLKQRFYEQTRKRLSNELFNY